MQINHSIRTQCPDPDSGYLLKETNFIVQRLFNQIPAQMEKLIYKYRVQFIYTTKCPHPMDVREWVIISCRSRKFFFY